MTRPTTAALRALEVQCAAATARAEAAERTAERLLATLERLAPAAALRPSVVAPLADAPPAPEASPAALPEELVRLCKRYDDGSARQFAINLRVARAMHAEGKSPEDIMRQIVRGEAVTV
jgi:hypothetical protein